MVRLYSQSPDFCFLSHHRNARMIICGDGHVRLRGRNIFDYPYPTLSLAHPLDDDVHVRGHAARGA